MSSAVSSSGATVPTAPGSPPARRRWKRILLWTTCILFGIVGLIALAAQIFIAPQIESQLIAAVEDHLHATIRVGKIRYHIPFTVHLYDVKLIGHPEINGGVELLSARRINISLASIPWGKGPVIIQRLAIIDPSAHIVRQPDGSIAGLDLVKPTGEQHPHGPMKLSDLLQLRRFMMRDGTVVVIDHTPHGTLGPTEWKNIDSDMLLTQNSPSLYSFHFTIANGGVAAASVNGSFDVDTLQLKVNRLAASVQASPGQAEPASLPPEVRHLLAQYNVGGSISFSGAGDIPLLSPSNSTFTSELSLSNAQARTVDGLHLDDLRVKLQADRAGGKATTRPVTVKLTQFDAMAGGAKFHVQPTTGRFDPVSGHWSVNGITGSFDSPVNGSSPPPWDLTGHGDFHADLITRPKDGLAAMLGTLTLLDIAIKPPGVEPISGLSGHAELGAVDSPNGSTVGAIVLHDVAINYGKDHWNLKRAQIPLAPLPGRVQIDRIEMQMQFASPAMRYPGDFGDVMDQLRPAGSYSMTGTGAMQWVDQPDPHYSPIWEMTIQPNVDSSGISDCSLGLLEGRLPVTKIIGELLLTKHAFDLRHLTGKALGGDLTISVNARVADPVTYQGHLDLNHASIEEAARLASDEKNSENLPTGDGHLVLDFFSRPAPGPTHAPTTNSDPDNATIQQLVDVLGADGRLHVVNGNLYSVAAVKNLTGKMKLAKEAFTAGEGGGVFSIINRAIYIKRGAVNMPALGLDGSGTVTFTDSWI